MTLTSPEELLSARSPPQGNTPEYESRDKDPEIPKKVMGGVGCLRKRKRSVGEDKTKSQCHRQSPDADEKEEVGKWKSLAAVPSHSSVVRGVVGMHNAGSV